MLALGEDQRGSISPLPLLLLCREQINQMPLYPTEAVLFDERQVPSTHWSGETCLALPKLNLQFLSYHDYLMRNFQLFRLESTYEIRHDLMDALSRMQVRPGSACILVLQRTYTSLPTLFFFFFPPPRSSSSSSLPTLLLFFFFPPPRSFLLFRHPFLFVSSTALPRRERPHSVPRLGAHGHTDGALRHHGGGPPSSRRVQACLCHRRGPIRRRPLPVSALGILDARRL